MTDVSPPGHDVREGVDRLRGAVESGSGVGDAFESVVATYAREAPAVDPPPPGAPESASTAERSHAALRRWLDTVGVLLAAGGERNGVAAADVIAEAEPIFTGGLELVVFEGWLDERRERATAGLEPAGRIGGVGPAYDDRVVAALR